jgi:hypothetical protein
MAEPHDIKIMARVGPAGGNDRAVFVRRPARPRRPPNLIAKKDLAELALQGLMAAAVVSRRPETLPAFCGRVSRMGQPLGGLKRIAPFKQGLRSVLGNIPDDEAKHCFDRWWEATVRRRLHLLQDCFGGPAPRVNLTGEEPLMAARARGQGTLIWASQFAFQTLAGKRGLCEAGIRAYQVSSDRHGFRNTRFGMRFLNRRLVQAENKYLAGRLVLAGREPGMVLRTVKRLLDAGETVIFTNNTYAGRSVVHMPLGPAGQICMSSTPLTLALQWQVPLFHMSTIEREPLIRYELRFSDDLASGLPAAAFEPATETAYQNMAHIALKARDELLHDIAEAPDQYMSWVLHSHTIPSFLSGA